MVFGNCPALSQIRRSHYTGDQMKIDDLKPEEAQKGEYSLNGRTKKDDGPGILICEDFQYSFKNIFMVFHL